MSAPSKIETTNPDADESSAKAGISRRCTVRISTLNISRPTRERSLCGLPLPADQSLHGTVSRPWPVICQTGRHTFLADSWAIPLPDASCDRIVCDGVFEYVRDDLALIEELTRLIRPGGQLVISVPYAGPLAWLDTYNLYHYIVDITGRGERPIETNEIGWRRHYKLADFRAMLTPAFEIRASKTSRLGVAEAIRLAMLLAFRWILRRDDLYHRCEPALRVLESLEDRIQPGNAGWRLTAEAVRASATEPTSPEAPAGREREPRPA